MLWLALHFPCFGLEVAERQAGLLPTQDVPRVLVRDNRICQRNAAAANLGVQPGSTLATAHSLAAAGTPLEHLHADADHEAARLRFLAGLLYRFSGEVSLEPPDAIVLEIGRSLRLFGSFAALEQAAVTLCEQLGHRACARTAATPSAALALARSGSRSLQSVPLASLALETKHLERFANMGLHTLGQVLHLPSRELGQRFGRALLGFLERLQGTAPDPRSSIVPPAHFSECLHLLEPLRCKEALEQPMQRLLDELAQWLTGQQLGAAVLVWRFLSHHPDATVRLPVRLSKAQQSARAFADISRLQLARVALPEDVLGIGLEARRLEPWVNQSLTLFRHGLGNVGLSGGLADRHAQPHAEPAELAGFVDQLTARLGIAACTHLHSLDQHAPERAWGIHRTGSTAPAASVAVGPQPLRRPLWLFASPRPVALEDLRLLEGPERVQSNWWAEAVNRDYYIAEHKSGARCWAYREPPAAWYLHGYFA